MRKPRRRKKKRTIEQMLAHPQNDEEERICDEYLKEATKRVREQWVRDQDCFYDSRDLSQPLRSIFPSSFDCEAGSPSDVDDESPESGELDYGSPENGGGSL